MHDGQFLLKLTLEMTNYFANKQDHAMKEQAIVEGADPNRTPTVSVF